MPFKAGDIIIDHGGTQFRILEEMLGATSAGQYKSYRVVSGGVETLMPEADLLQAEKAGAKWLKNKAPGATSTTPPTPAQVKPIVNATPVDPNVATNQAAGITPGSSNMGVSPATGNPTPVVNAAPVKPPQTPAPKPAGPTPQAPAPTPPIAAKAAAATAGAVPPGAANTSGISGKVLPATGEPWFRALKGESITSTWNELVDDYTRSMNLKDWWSKAKPTITRFWEKATPFEKAAISEPLTAPFGPLGEAWQAKMMAGISTKSLPAGQRVAVGAIKFGLPALFALGLFRAGYKAVHKNDQNQAPPPRYKEAYSRLHAMHNGQPFFGSGANLDAIVAFGRSRMGHGISLHRPIKINPARGGAPQELFRQANTHYMPASTAAQFNTRLFNTVV